MQDLLWFLPLWPPDLGELVAFGALLIAGLVGGEVANRWLSLPRITGYVLSGIAFGPEGFGLVRAPLLDETRVIVDLALGLVMFELGARLDAEWFARNRWLFVAALGESLGAFFAIYAGLLWFGFSPLLAGCAAAVGTATSPAVVILVAHELRASGQITERMLLFTAVNCAAAFVALMLLLPLLHLEYRADWRTAILHPAYLLFGAALLGYLASRTMLALARWVGKREDRQFVLLVATIVLVVGLARAAEVTVVVALLTLGMLARNLDRDHVLVPLQFGYAGQLLFVVLFVITGASLDFGLIGPAALAAVAFIVLRFLGKAAAILVLGRLSGLRPGGGGLLSLSLLPMSGLAVIMVWDTAVLFPSFGMELATVVMSAAAILELIGPLATQAALRLAGEAGAEKTR
ncbi:MAG TPA: cation:proton antiporter [Burkholderiales bacterium]